MATMTVPARFNGPRESGQGGYSAGLLAAELTGAAAVSLRSPVPLDTPLSLAHENGRVRALDGETVIAEADPAAPLALEVPAPVSVEQARSAAQRFPCPDDGPFGDCFVCGSTREDSFGVFAGKVEDRDLFATPWTPARWTAGADGAVRPEFVWAALDCPSYVAAYRGEIVLAFLVRHTVELRAPVATGVEHVLLAWPLAKEGRKSSAGVALLSAAGEVLALSEALMVEPRASA